MAKLYQLPNGQAVDPNRVSSIAVVYPEFDEPHISVKTQDGFSTAFPASMLEGKPHEGRNTLIEKINELRD